MKPDHHLDDATLLSYSAGALPLPLSVVASAHLAVCARCRIRLRQADALGGALIEADIAPRGEKRPRDAEPISAAAAAARTAMLRRLDQSDSTDEAGMNAARATGRARHGGAGLDVSPTASGMEQDDALPVAVQPYFGATLSGVRWRFLAPGVQHVRARVPEGRLFLLKLAPGIRLLEHGHGRNELSLILRGAYTDHLGVFRAGDVADLDSDVEHQPVITSAEPCITLGATDAPMRIKSRGLRLLQPWLRL